MRCGLLFESEEWKMSTPASIKTVLAYPVPLSLPRGTIDPETMMVAAGGRWKSLMEFRDTEAEAPLWGQNGAPPQPALWPKIPDMWLQNGEFDTKYHEVKSPGAVLDNAKWSYGEELRQRQERRASRASGVLFEGPVTVQVSPVGNTAPGRSKDPPSVGGPGAPGPLQGPPGLPNLGGQQSNRTATSSATSSSKPLNLPRKAVKSYPNFTRDGDLVFHEFTSGGRCVFPKFMWVNEAARYLAEVLATVTPASIASYCSKNGVDGSDPKYERATQMFLSQYSKHDMDEFEDWLTAEHRILPKDFVCFMLARDGQKFRTEKRAQGKRLHSYVLDTGMIHETAGY